MSRWLAVVFAALLPVVLLGGCNENFAARDGCEGDEDCRAPRVCQAGLCVDLDEVDAGGGDVELDVPGVDVPEPPDAVTDVPVPPDGGVDTPDVPAPIGRLLLTPSRVDLGPIELGETGFVGMRLENVGGAPLLVEDIAVESERGDWRVDTDGTGPLDAGEIRIVTVALDARVLGETEAEMRVTWDGGVRTAQILARVIDAEAGCLAFDQPEVDLGPVLPGERFLFETRLQNCGAVPVGTTERVFPPDGEFRFDASEVPEVLNPGQVAIVTASFVGTPEPGAREGQLRIGDGVAEATLTVRAFVETLPGEVCFEPVREFVNLGRTPVRETAFAEVSFRNCGEVDVQVVGAELETDGVYGAELREGFVPPGGIFTAEVFATSRAAGTFENELRLVLADGTLSRPVRLTVQVFDDDEPLLCLEPLASPGVFFAEVGEEVEVTALWINCGSVPVRIETIGLDLDGPFPASFRIDETSDEEVEPGEVFEVDLVFGATRTGFYEGVVTVAGSDLVSEQAVLFEVFDGGGEACLDVDPPSLNFGTLEVGEGTARELGLMNCGERAIAIPGVRMQNGRLGFLVTGGGFTLAPGEARTLTVQFSQDDVGSFRDAVRITTDAAELGTISVPVQAVVSDATFCPTLRAGGSTNDDGPFRAAVSAVEGDDVFLDAGYPVPGAPGVDFAWELVEFDGVRPPEIIDTRTNGRVILTETFVGRYLYEVTYVSPDGCVGTDLVEVEIDEDTGVGEGIRVVISWRTPGDEDEFQDPGSDVDLHVARRVDGRTRWNSEDDCYYANRETEWGNPRVEEDNGRLLRDEVNGVGPEIFVLEQPAAGERWLVAVHYFSDDMLGPSDVTLRIFRNGVQQVSNVRRLEDGGDVWLAAEISDQGRTIELLGGDNYRGFPPATAP